MGVADLIYEAANTQREVANLTREAAKAAQATALAAHEARHQTARVCQATFVVLLLIAAFGCRYVLTSGEYVGGEVALIRTVAVLCFSIAFCTTVNLLCVCVLGTAELSYTGHFILAICILVIYLCAGKIVGYDRIF